MSWNIEYWNFKHNIAKLEIKYQLILLITLNMIKFERFFAKLLKSTNIKHKVHLYIPYQMLWYG